ncbi:MAG TPA: hypothetical protein DCQ04_09565 [Actinobacteria bacterium]|jgi:uncharacterized membrane protein|nr:hypothetical protein [Actinomycetota bacterium]
MFERYRPGMTSAQIDPWSRRYYPREGDGVGFDRVVFFSDAVFAIAITLMAVEIGVPEAEEADSAHALWSALAEKGPAIGAFVVAFAWVAVYWRANHRFTTALARMSSRYIAFLLLYLGLVALLPVPAGMLGEYWSNPVAIVVFAIYGALMSSMEVVLFIVADRDDMFLAPMTSQFRRWMIVGSLTPVVAFLAAIPLAFISTLAAIAAYLVVAVLLGILVNKVLGPTSG